MHSTRKVNNDIVWLGASDRVLPRFENVFPIPEGISYNAYLVKDEKTILFDTTDSAVGERFFENLDYALEGRKLDYHVILHMEPDHAATLDELVLRHPEVKIVVNQKTLGMIRQFFDFDIDARAHLVSEGDSLVTGAHSFTFLMAPMVHWPEVMVAYDSLDKVLFSADAFGTFGALAGNIFADEVDFEKDWLPRARRYYSNIVGKYGPQVKALLGKAKKLDIQMICPLHGPVWRENLDWYLDKYQKWAAWEPEEKGVLIAYGSIYGNTAKAADILALKLAERGVRKISVLDAASTHPSYILSEAFRLSHLVFASSSYNNGIFTPMETLLLSLKAHLLQNRTVAIIENGSWAPCSGKQMREHLCQLKNTRILEETLCIRSSLKAEQEPALNALADALVRSLSD